MWDQLASEINIPFDHCGIYAVAIENDEIPRLEQLYQQGKKNGVSGMSLIPDDEIKRRNQILTHRSIKPNGVAFGDMPMCALNSPIQNE